MKNFKKIGSLVLALVMVFAMSATALAVQPEPGVVTDGNVPIVKTITMRNNTSGTYYSPTVTFTYKITPATSDELALNATVGGSTVLSGPTGGLIGKTESVTTHAVTTATTDANVAGTEGKHDNGYETVTLQFLSKSVDNVDSKGAEVSETLTLSVVADKFPHAGIYRYRFEDVTELPAIKAGGLERPSGYNATTVRYIDVYIQNKEDGTGLEPAGAVVAKEEATNQEVPKRDSEGKYIQVSPSVATGGSDPTTNPSDPPAGKKYDPKDGYRVDNDGNLYKLKDGQTDTNPIDLTNSDVYEPVLATDPDGVQVKVEMVSNGKLSKEGEAYSETPVKEFTDDNKDGNPDKLTSTGAYDSNTDGTPDGGTPSSTDGLEPVYDDEGNPVGTDGKSYPAPEYRVIDGEIKKLKDDATPAGGPYGNDQYETITDTNGDPAPVYQKYRGTYDYKGDVYNTYNITLKKVVAGTMGDKEHEFDFAATVTNNGLNFKVAKNAADADNAGPIAVASYDLLTNLKHEDVYFLRGLNAKATVTYTETNDAEETYKVKIEDNTPAVVNSVNDVEVVKTGTATTGAAANITDYGTEYKAFGDSVTEQAVKNITYTNTLDTVSPTGVALRFAPYLFMLAAAAMFVVLSRRQREQENA